MIMKIVILVVGLTLIFFLAAMATRWHYRQRARTRKPVSIEQFLAALPAGIDRQIARAVHASFVSSTGVTGYPLEPTDELGKDFGIYGADFEDLFETLTAECGVHLPDGSAADVKTVEDVIVLLDKYRSA